MTNEIGNIWFASATIMAFALEDNIKIKGLILFLSLFLALSFLHQARKKGE